MLIEQIFHEESCSYSYLLIDKINKLSIVIDSVKELVPIYIDTLNRYSCTLHYAVETHLHADHITGMGELRELTGCQTIVGEMSTVSCADKKIIDGECIKVGSIALKAIYTPGHTDDSYCYYLESNGVNYLFTGDTLLIGGTGRTDFQSGSSKALFNSLFKKILLLPNDTIVYPGHDYNGNAKSTIGKEKQHNPRLQVSDWQELANILDHLNLARPKMMDIAIPSNQSCGQ